MGQAVVLISLEPFVLATKANTAVPQVRQRLQIARVHIRQHEASIAALLHNLPRVAPSWGKK